MVNGYLVDTKLVRYVYTIFRKVNGVPWRDSFLTIWVHRSGRIELVQLSGLLAMTSGDPGFEYPVKDVGSVVNRFSNDSLRDRLKLDFETRFGGSAVPHVVWSGVLYLSDDTTTDGAVVRPWFKAAIAPEVGGVAARALTFKYRLDENAPPIVEE